MLFIPITLIYTLSTALVGARPTRTGCPKASALGSLNVKFLQTVSKFSLQGQLWNRPFTDFDTTQLNHGTPIEGMCLYTIRNKDSWGPTADLIVKIPHDPDNPETVSTCEEKSGHLVAKGSTDGDRVAYVVRDIPMKAQDSSYVPYHALPEYQHACAKLLETTSERGRYLQAPEPPINVDAEFAEECEDLFGRLQQAMGQYITDVAELSNVINGSLNLDNTLFRIEQTSRSGGPKVTYSARFFGGMNDYLMLPANWNPNTFDPFIKWASQRESTRAFSDAADDLDISAGQDRDLKMPIAPVGTTSCGAGL